MIKGLAFLLLLVSYIQCGLFSWLWKSDDKKFKELENKSREQRKDLPSIPPRYLDSIALPLKTTGRWIVDGNGERVKFACVNFVAHMEAMVPEGLSQDTLPGIAKKIRNMGFNCVRYTFSSEQLRMRDRRIKESVEIGMSSETRQQFYEINRGYFNEDSTILEVWDLAVHYLAREHLFVIMDNHITQAKWCCSINDMNRWWGQKFLKTDEWVETLETMTIVINRMNWWNVVGVGLRNEPHVIFSWNPAKQWFENMRKGAEAVARHDPNMLVIVSGMQSGSYLKQLKNQDFVTTEMDEKYPFLKHRIIFESHYYNLFYIRPFWSMHSYNGACNKAHYFLDSRNAFILDPKQNDTRAAPIFFSEFGLDVESYSEDPSEKSISVDRKWLQCVTDWMVKWDVDWAYWVLHSHYYKREGMYDYNETWGLSDLASNDYYVKNAYVMRKLHSVMNTHMGPGIN